MASDSIQVQVKLFATLRQAAGWSERTVTLPPGATVAELLAQLETATPALKLSGRAVYAAVNQQYTRGTQTLANGDVVAVFPPVSGGVR